jgi:hypothetical protein
MIFFLSTGCLRGQDSQDSTNSPIAQNSTNSGAETETFFGREVPFDYETHMYMLQLLLRMNWFDNESVYLPQIENTSIELERIFYSDFENRIIRIYENPESRRKYTASLSFNPEGLISEYLVRIAPQIDVNSTALSSIRQIDVDYQNNEIRRQYSRDDGFQYDVTYPIRVFISDSDEITLFIDSAFGRLRAIQKKGEYYYLFVGRKDEDDPFFGLEFFPIGRVYQSGNTFGYQLFYNWDPEVIHYETIFRNSREIEYLKYDTLRNEIRFRRVAHPEREQMYQIQTEDLFENSTSSDYRIITEYDENDVLVYEAIEFEDGSGVEQFIRYIE